MRGVRGAQARSAAEGGRATTTVACGTRDLSAMAEAGVEAALAAAAAEAVAGRALLARGMKTADDADGSGGGLRAGLWGMSSAKWSTVMRWSMLRGSIGGCREGGRPRVRIQQAFAAAAACCSLSLARLSLSASAASADTDAVAGREAIAAAGIPEPLGAAGRAEAG